MKTSFFFLYLFNKFVSVLHEFLSIHPNSPNMSNGKTCVFYRLPQHKTSWTVRHGWRMTEVLDMSFSLWSDGGEFGFLDPLQDQHTRGPCILAWETGMALVYWSLKREEIMGKFTRDVCYPVFVKHVFCSGCFVSFRVLGSILTFHKALWAYIETTFWSPRIV